MLSISDNIIKAHCKKQAIKEATVKAPAKVIDKKSLNFHVSDKTIKSITSAKQYKYLVQYFQTHTTFEPNQNV